MLPKLHRLTIRACQEPAKEWRTLWQIFEMDFSLGTAAETLELEVERLAIFALLIERATVMWFNQTYNNVRFYPCMYLLTQFFCQLLPSIFLFS